MPSELVGLNVVIVARQFNPSVFSQMWLVRNGLVDEHGFGSGCLFSDEVAKIETQEFSLLIIPPQLQFQPRVSPEREAETVTQKVGTIVRTLPHTPFVAVGLNFAWHVWSENGDVQAISRSLFLPPSGAWFDACRDAENAMFGAYVSRDVLGCRLRLDVKPVDVSSDSQTVRRLHFAFNFQLDVPQENAVAAIEQHLCQWREAKDEASRVITLVEGCMRRTI